MLGVTDIIDTYRKRAVRDKMMTKQCKKVLLKDLNFLDRLLNHKIEYKKIKPKMEFFDYIMIPTSTIMIELSIIMNISLWIYFIKYYQYQ